MSRRKLLKLNEEEANEVLRLRAPVVYTAIKREGEDELARPAESLWWSGVGAGVAIFLSVIATGALYSHVGQAGPAKALMHLGYAMGFLVVILGRLQLFTENTIMAVIPLFSSTKKSKTFISMVKLWTVVFMANMVGVFIAAAATLHTGLFTDGITAGIIDISRHYVHRTPFEFFAQAVPAGFIVAALVWMLPSSRGSEFWVIVAMTYLISVAELTHVIAGAGEVFVVMLLGEISLLHSFTQAILPTFAGNVLGGTALFAVLVYGQVKEEI